MTSLSDPNLASKLTVSLNGLYAGSYLAGVFYGLTTHQTFVYFRRSGKDSLYTRILILLLWILDTLHAVLAAVALRKVTQESIVNPLSMLINNTPWTLSFSLFMMSISDSGVRGFYCFRIWRLSQKNWVLTSIAIFPVICALIAGLYCTSKTVAATGLHALDLIVELDVTLISVCVADSILAGFLCILLWSSRSGIKRTNSVISTLILYTVTTGLLTSIVAIATLTIMLTMKGTFAYAGAFYMLSKLYFSSLLATLNRREKIRTQMHATSGAISVPLETGNSAWPKGASVMAFNKTINDGAQSTTTSETGKQRDGTVSRVSEVVPQPRFHAGHTASQLSDVVEIKVDKDVVLSNGYAESEVDHDLSHSADDHTTVTSMA